MQASADQSRRAVERQTGGGWLRCGAMLKMPETPLQRAKRHVAVEKSLIRKQKALITASVQANQPTEIARQMLETMERTLSLYQQDLDRLSQSN